jgi:CDP-6-deoxy-D-xylo-4-hexulose-3-dehydrase
MDVLQEHCNPLELSSPMLESKLNDYLKAKILRSWGRLSSIAKDSENIKERLNIKIGGYNYDRKFVFQELGFNFEPSEIGAAFGLEQLKKLKLFSALRNINYNHHIFFFKNFSEYFIIF